MTHILFSYYSLQFTGQKNTRVLAGYLRMLELKENFLFFLLLCIYQISHNEYITFVIKVK